MMNFINNTKNKILYLVCLFSLYTTTCLATEDIEHLDTGNAEVDATISSIIQILSVLGFAIAIGKLMQIGIMFMLGAGKRNGAKDALFPWLVGALVCILFGTLGPWVIDLFMSGSSGDVFNLPDLV